MLAYERASWTDDQLNPAKPKEHFKLPDVEGGVAQWRWVEGSEWHVESTDDGLVTLNGEPSATTDKTKPGGPKPKSSSVRPADISDVGWTYFDSKWQDPRRGADGWTRYTRRRKWYRDAELTESTRPTPPLKPHIRNTSALSDTFSNTTDANTVTFDTTTLSQDDAISGTDSARGSQRRGPRWFNRNRSASKASSVDSGTTAGVESAAAAAYTFPPPHHADAGDADGYIPMLHQGRQGAVPADWGVAEDVGMELG